MGLTWAHPSAWFGLHVPLPTQQSNREMVGSAVFDITAGDNAYHPVFESGLRNSWLPSLHGQLIVRVEGTGQLRYNGRRKN